MAHEELVQAVQAFIDAAEDYRIHSELLPYIKSVDKTIRMLETRNALREALAAHAQPPQEHCKHAKVDRLLTPDGAFSGLYCYDCGDMMLLDQEAHPEPREAQGCRPIETAPKDGTLIISALIDDRGRICRIHDLRYEAQRTGVLHGERRIAPAHDALDTPVTDGKKGAT